MPEVCRFLGIVIKMFFEDHNPPHFHVVYGNLTATFSIDTLEKIDGFLPPRVQGLVIEWASINQDKLKLNWKLASKNLEVKKIKPLV